MEKLIYSKVLTKTLNECIVTSSAHVVEVHNVSTGNTVGYVATRSAIYHGWLGFDSRSQSFVYDDKEKAIAFCEEYFKDEEEVTE